MRKTLKNLIGTGLLATTIALSSGCAGLNEGDVIGTVLDLAAENKGNKLDAKERRTLRAMANLARTSGNREHERRLSEYPETIIINQPI